MTHFLPLEQRLLIRALPQALLKIVTRAFKAKPIQQRRLIVAKALFFYGSLCLLGGCSLTAQEPTKASPVSPGAQADEVTAPHRAIPVPPPERLSP